jgi:PiT family inorganic phosphate transporter
VEVEEAGSAVRFAKKKALARARAKANESKDTQR